MGFFSSGTLKEKRAPRGEISLDTMHRLECKICPLNRAHLNNPKMQPTGSPEALLYFIGEAPGKTEDEEGEQFVGKSGDLLRPLIPSSLRRKIRWNNTIRCFPATTMVVPLGKIKKGFKRWYEGRMITAITKNGRKLTGTPNHPILTSKGWVALGDIQEGDQLLCYGGQVENKMGRSDPNVNYSPLSFEELYHSLLPLGSVRRVVGSSANFYGEIPKGDVDIVSIPGELMDCRKFFGNESLVNSFFKLSRHTFAKELSFSNSFTVMLDKSSISTIFSFVSKAFFFNRVCAIPSDLPLGRISEGHSFFEQGIFYRAWANVFNFSNFFYTGSRNIGGCKVLGRYPSEFSSPTQSFGLSQNFADNVITPPSNITDFCNRSSIKIEFDDVLSITCTDNNFSGHVYTLETEASAYIADGIIVGNCRPENNRNPEKIETECCRPSIENDIARVQPIVVIGFGNYPLRWATGFDNTPMWLWRGRHIPLNINGHRVWFIPTYHPAGLLRQRKIVKDRFGNFQREEESLDETAFRRDLNNIFETFADLPEPRPHNIKDVEKGVQLVTGKKGEHDFNLVMEFLDRAARSKLSGIDLECKGLRPYFETSKILTVAISLGLEDTLSFAWQHPQSGWTPQQYKSIRNKYIDYLTSRSRKAVHNLAFEQEYHAYEFGYDILRAGLWEDTMSQASALDERFSKKLKSGPLSLDFLVMQHFGFRLKELNEHLDKNNLDKEPLLEVLRYNGPDAKYHRALCVLQEDLLEERGLMDSYDVKLRQVPTCVLTQLQGVPVNQEVTTALSVEYGEKIDRLEVQLRDLSVVREFKQMKGEDLKLGSNPHLQFMMANVIRTSIGRRDDGTYDTEADVMKELKHPFGDLLVEWRQATKVKSTYVDPYKRVYPDGLLHPQFNTVFTHTWRLSCEDPNMQNQIKRSKEAKKIRRQVEAEIGKLIASFDYGQIEARVLAMASRDRTFCKALWENYDIHKEWALRIAKRYPAWIVEPMHQFIAGSQPKADPTDKAIFSSYRNKVKNEFVFPLFFGAGLFKISNELGIPEENIKPERDEFWRIFTGVADWQEETNNFYLENGYVETLTGHHRRRYPLTYNELINEPIQGTTAEIVMNAMCDLSEHAEEINDWNFQPRLNIHDDLTFILPEKRVDEYAEVIIEKMLNVRFPFVNVPISVEMQIGKTWDNLHDVGTYTSDQWLNYPARMDARFSFAN